MKIHATLALVGCLVIMEAFAADQSAARAMRGIVDLPTVTADRPTSGPRIWTFVKGSTTLRVLGTVQPLPRDLQFDTSGILDALQTSDALLTGEGVVTGEGVGLVRGLLLLPSMRRLKRNTSDRTLRDILSDTDYQEWRRLSDPYLSGMPDVERMRPMYAAGALYEAAIARERLHRHHPAKSSISGMARTLGIPLIDGRLHVRIAHPKEAINAFHVDKEDDLRCFREVLRRLPPWLGTAKQAGNEWSSGSYRNIPQAPPRCWSWLTNQAIARTQGILLEQAVRQQWMRSLDSAASMHSNIFTTMPIEDLESGSGLASALFDDGYISISHDHLQKPYE
ncbi:TraB/GumN family protein [Stenotrophomonas sp. 278]|uniref:TraB/GumN family protein n=1 Tax=Stenotrophomonas sp. 278 TaxID=2479851 RepID=UPI0016399411|nr:TraB/GumN family protein [Stenotrophomonas sp. 278]